MSCAPPSIIVGGVVMSTSDFENARELLAVSGDGGDPTLDGDDESIAGGNNSAGRSGVQIANTVPTQTTSPGKIPYTASASIDTSTNTLQGTPIVTPAWTGDYDQALSTNFKVRDFTINSLFKNQLIDYLTYTKDVRFGYMSNLANNVAEPLLAKFGAFNVNSGLRNKSSTPSGVSQHILGQAFDIQFPGWTYLRYWENANWIKNNIPYDQFIFEHSDKTGLAWYHLSYNPAGNRAPTVSTKVMTMYRNFFSPGLHRYG